MRPSQWLPGSLTTLLPVLFLVISGCAGGASTEKARIGVPAPTGEAAHAVPAHGPEAPLSPEREYRVFVGSEATDRISLVVFGPEGARVEREFTVSLYPTEADGPHGLAMSSDGRWLYLTTGHGRPFGNLWKIDPETGRSVGRVELGLFPASLDVSPDGDFAWVVNFNLHGDMVPSSVSVVATGPMIEVSRIETCTMPHGSRLSPDGRRQYSACMMDDLLVEVDAWGLGVARHFHLAPGREHGMSGAPADHGGHGAHGEAEGGHDPVCSPTWAQPSADGSSVFVACNRTGELVEVEAEGWRMIRRLPAAPGIYNLDVTSDGRLLVATNKQDHSVSIFDLATGEETVRIPTHRRVVHGVVISPDDRYAFVTVEGIGSEPGTLEVIDLSAGQSVARVDLPQMSAGVAFWR
jgi:DNA-binding beta-propeller fold protein YncE